MTCPNLKAPGLCRMWWSCTKNSLGRVCKHHGLDNLLVCPALLLSRCLWMRVKDGPVHSLGSENLLSQDRGVVADTPYLCLAGCRSHSLFIPSRYRTDPRAFM